MQHLYPCSSVYIRMYKCKDSAQLCTIYIHVLVLPKKMYKIHIHVLIYTNLYKCNIYAQCIVGVASWKRVITGLGGPYTVHPTE